MVQVRNTGHTEFAVFRELDEQPCQRDGVGPAGQSDDDPRAWRHKGVTPNRPANLLVKGSHLADNLRWACQPKLAERAKVGAGGRTRTADPALMRRVL